MYDEKHDVWALGAMLYLMATLRPAPPEGPFVHLTGTLVWRARSIVFSGSKIKAIKMLHTSNSPKKMFENGNISPRGPAFFIIKTPYRTDSVLIRIYPTVLK